MQFNIEPKRSFVLVTCSGDYDLDGFEDMLTQALSIATSMGLLKILFDARGAKGNLTIMDFFDLGTMVSRVVTERLPPRVKMAFVGSESFLDPTRFGEMVAKNRGVNGIVTSEIAEALKYLEVEREFDDAVGPD